MQTLPPDESLVVLLSLGFMSSFKAEILMDSLCCRGLWFVAYNWPAEEQDRLHGRPRLFHCAFSPVSSRVSTISLLWLCAGDCICPPWVPGSAPELNTLSCRRHPNSTDSLLFFADDQGDTDPNVVMLDGYVDVLYTNFSSPTKPFALIDNADAYVGLFPPLPGSALLLDLLELGSQSTCLTKIAIPSTSSVDSSCELK